MYCCTVSVIEKKWFVCALRIELYKIGVLSIGGENAKGTQGVG